MKFLTREQFERQAFIHYLRTGEFYYYQDYLKWKENVNFEKLKILEEIKDFKNDFQKFKEEIFTNEMSELKNNIRYVVWRTSRKRKQEKKNYSDIPTAPAVYIYAYPDEDEGGDDSKSDDPESASCEDCNELEGKVFQEGSEPSKPHPNCNCTAEYIDEDGEGTGEYKDLKEFEPQEKINSPEIEKDHNGLISNDYGERIHPIFKEPKMHHGQDWRGVPEGTPIVSTQDGVVKHVDYIRGFGNTAIISHADGSTTTYAHMSERSPLAVGEKIAQGDFIGYIGKTGDATGPHLHYERRDSNNNSFRPEVEEINFLIDYFTPFKYK